jgi:hypothetical protein
VAEQNYANHAYRATLWLCASAGALSALILSVVVIIRQPSLASVTLLILAVTLVITVSVIRRFALRLQNRIIRLEMQVRLARLGHSEYLSRLALPQLIAVRFASDAELPALLARAVSDKLTPDQIKRAIGDWQADEMRT